jgi:hypothetical protein
MPHKGGIRAISESRIGAAYKRIGKTYSRGIGEASEGGARAVSERRIRKTYKGGMGAAGAGHKGGIRTLSMRRAGAS